MVTDTEVMVTDTEVSVPWTCPECSTRHDGGDGGQRDQLVAKFVRELLALDETYVTPRWVWTRWQIKPKSLASRRYRGAPEEWVKVGNRVLYLRESVGR